jgi:hypothetical protein
MRVLALVLAAVISTPASALTIETNRALGTVVKKDCTHYRMFKGVCHYVIEADGILLSYRGRQKTHTPYFEGEQVAVEYVQHKKGWHVLSVSK